MTTCPWCGTSYKSFQPKCSQCGGSLPLPVETAPAPKGLVAPPPPPRSVPHQIVWRILFTDGLAIAGLVFLLLGLVFGILGTALTVSIVAAFLGLPFAGLGAAFLAAAAPILVWRLQMAQRTVKILEQGKATEGEIVTVQQQYWVRVNGRHPWTMDYAYQVHGNRYSGRITILSQPNLNQQPGTPVYVLYLGDEPGCSTLYPSPYGYSAPSPAFVY